MANEHLGALPAGLSAADFTMGDSLLDYTPPNVQWQAPMAAQGENVFANYVKAYPDILKDYNRRLARPVGTTGALPLMEGGYPQSMSSYGLQHWNEFGQGEDRNLYQPLGLWGDPGRNPYLAYGGTGPVGQGLGPAALGLLSARAASGSGDTSGADVTNADALAQALANVTQAEEVIQTEENITPELEEEVVQEVEEEVANIGKPEYGGHTNYHDWYMDPTNQFGHYWSLGYDWDFGQQRYKNQGTFIY